MGAHFCSRITEVGTWTALVAALILPSESDPGVEGTPGCLGAQKLLSEISFEPDRVNGPQAQLRYKFEAALNASSR